MAQTAKDLFMTKFNFNVQKAKTQTTANSYN